MKIAYGTYALPVTPLEESIPLLAGIGYDGVEICVGPKHIASLPADYDAARRAAIRSLLTQHDLGVPALMIMGRHVLAADEATHQENLAFMQQAAQLSRDFGMGEHPVLSLGIGGKSPEWAAKRDLIVQRLQDYARIAAQDGFVLAAEAHCGAAVDRSERALYVINQTNSPQVGLHFDIVHFYLAGEDEAEAVQRLLPITAHTHITDARKHTDGSFDLLLLGDGTLDSAKYVKAMHEGGWNDFITLEVSARVWGKPEYDPIQAARSSYAELAGAFERAGVPRG